MSRVIKKLKKIYVLGISLLLCGHIFVCSASEQSYFATYFPVTLYKRVLDTSAYILTGIEDLSDETVPHENKLLLQDLIIGRIVRLSFLIQSLSARYQAGSFDSHDKEYLVTMLTTITDAYKVLMTPETALAYTLLVNGVRVLEQLD